MPRRPGQMCIHRYKILQGVARPTYPAYVWDGEKFVGELGNGHGLSFLCAPGKHTFVCSTPSVASAVEANLRAGKTYDFYISKSKLGMWETAFDLNPINSGDSRREEVEGWLENQKAVKLNPEKAAVYEESHRNLIRGIIHDFTEGSKKERLTHMAASDHR